MILICVGLVRVFSCSVIVKVLLLFIGFVVIGV